MPDHENGDLPHGSWQAGASVFVASIIVSAALLFMVEPMFTRMVLPRFGGSASVWSVAIAFFQGALLLGYLYAHALNRLFAVRTGVLIHLAVLGAGALWLPLTTHSALAGGGGEATRLIGVFVLSLGPPFVALSANAPLLQAWFARSGLAGAHNPYPLYAASNAGSLLALIAYPVLVEPASGLAAQSAAWSLGYGGLMVLVAWAGWLARAGGRAVRGTRRPLAPQSVLRWVALSLVPSAGLVAVTAHMSTDIAAAPFLWVAPLALYLLTFVIVFSPAGAGQWVQWLAAPALVGLAAVVGLNLRLGIGWDVLIHLGGFFVLALACHARLATLRPDVGNLTAFYLAMSFGGMVGGVLAALVAPAMASFVVEYPLVLLSAALVLRRGRWLVPAAVAALLLVGVALPLDVRSRQTSRSFFGVHTVEVTRDGQFRTLRHGLEIHGAQRIASADGRSLTGLPEPLTYYHVESPISEAIDAVRAARGGGPIRIGVVGLGTGSIACLAEPGDTLDFYEIDPAVIAIARDAATFSFLSRCAPRANIITGDARQTLAASAATYDILIVDAFSSDAIPVHLLTGEALDIYLARLGTQGVALLHISNNHLRLQDILAATARTRGLALRLNDEEGDEAAARQFIYQPTVMALARTPEALGALASSEEWTIPPPTTTPGWSDDYANLLGALIGKLREP